jgi:dinuclear metal center YbgI/SA1388 family protein
MHLAQICSQLDIMFPPALAADWDNTGLLVGRPTAEIERVMTCLTLTPDSVSEAVAERADLVVSHHPLPFRGVKQLTTDKTAGGLLLQLAENGVAVYSPHTAFDSAAAGINQQWAQGLGLTNVHPIIPGPVEMPDLGSGRIGDFSGGGGPADLVRQTKAFLDCDHVRVVGGNDRPVHRVAVACGAAGDFLGPAIAAGCDAFLTGETNFHTCLESQARGVLLILVGHFASERFAVVRLAKELGQQFTNLKVWASNREANPWRLM